MFRNYFKTGFRNLWKDKTSSVINLIGLAIGMACCMLIMIYIKDELSYNKFNSNYNIIYRVNWNSTDAGQTTVNATTPIVLAPVASSEIPQLQFTARLFQRSGQMQAQTNDSLYDEGKRFQELNAYFADEDLVHIFSIPFLEGNVNTALSSINSVVLTDEMARKYFGSNEALGKTLLYDNKVLLQVTGVVQKLPANSDLQFDFLISFETLFNVESQAIVSYLKTDWTFNPATTYILLKPGQPTDAVNASLNQLLKKYGDERNQQLNSIALQPLSDIHLHAASVSGNPSTNSIAYILIFAAIAFLILLIANVNFINLATARSMTRFREVGMRKVMGATKKQLVLQFLSETVLLSFIAFFVALIIAQLCLPLLNQLTQKNLSWQSWINVQNLILFALIFFCTGIMAGLYPAFFISKYQPALAMKGKSGETGRKNLSGKVLLVTQFTISIILTIGAIIIYQQLEYLRDTPLGFQKNQMVVVPIFGSGASSIDYGVDAPMRQRMNTFANELSTYNKINAVTACSAMPGQGYIRGLVIPEGHTQQDNIFVPWVSVDYNFIQTLNIPLVAGRNFSKSTGTDHLNAFILSESAVQSFGWKNPEDAIGKNIIRGDEKDGKKGQVIGVIKDFNFNTLDQPMQPLIMDVSAARFTQFAISIQPDHVDETIQYIRDKWKANFPERVFEFSFLDDDINALYNSQEILARIIEFFAMVAVFLSCLGLFSLSSFLSVQRTKEIGIRKVLGASISGIVGLLSADFMKLVLISIAIASPLAFYFVKLWLQNYAYRIGISVTVFIIAGIAALFVAFLTICIQSIRAALANPIKSLRTE